MSSRDEAKSAIIQTQNLKKWFPLSKGLGEIISRAPSAYVKAVDGVDIVIEDGTTYGIVGESGCGKTTLGKLLIRLLEPTDGSLQFIGHDITHLGRKEMKPLRRQMQIIYQDPFSSLPVRLTADEILTEPFRIHKICECKEEKDERVYKLLEDVGLEPPEIFLGKHPNQISGGQRQRLSIARALALNPKFIVADEPVSMLDLSVRAGILNLLRQLKDEHDLTMLLITHDLASAQYMCKTIGIMYLGRIAEEGPSKDVLEEPYHPYTMLLKSALATLDPRTKHHLQELPTEAEIPSAIDLPPGCRFSTRCVYSKDICRKEEPQLRDFGGRRVACHGVDNWIEEN